MVRNRQWTAVQFKQFKRDFYPMRPLCFLLDYLARRTGWRRNPFLLDDGMNKESRRDAIRRYDRAIAVLEAENADQLEALANEIEGFPEGVDPYVGRRWIINAIDLGSRTSVEWILRSGVNLNFRDEEGYTPIHAVLERKRDDRYELLEILLGAGAPVDLKGVNDWTPAHMAAARDDVDALRLLVRHGADLSIRTDIDDHATPLEEARNLGKLNAVKYLESIV